MTQRQDIGWLFGQVNHIWRRIIRMALNFDRLEREVGELTTVVDGVVALLTALATEIRDSAGNQAKMEALADKIDAEQARIAAAVAAQTPGE